MDKASVTSPIDSLKNGFEAVYRGYGRRHTGKSWKIKNTNVQKGHLLLFGTGLLRILVVLQLASFFRLECCCLVELEMVRVTFLKPITTHWSG